LAVVVDLTPRETVVSDDVPNTPEASQPSQPEIGGIPAGESIAPRPGMQWYVLHVASNKEDQVRDTLDKKVKIEQLEDSIGRVLVPTQREKRMRGGKAHVYDRKLYPGYVFIEMVTEDNGAIPDDVWFVIKETSGVGDFISSDGKPTPMKTHDVERMLAVVEKATEAPTLAGLAGMVKGDQVKVKDGPFENYEGEIDEVMPDKGQVRVIINIFGRSTPIELEYWQIEKI
jgi:transcriptional antiterminator NusG